jgi:hypothetical protein
VPRIFLRSVRVRFESVNLRLSISCTGPASRAHAIERRPCTGSRSSPRCFGYFRGSGPASKKRADFDRQKRFRAPAPSAHAVHRAARKSPSHAKEGSRGAQRTAPGTAYTFARLGMSVTCLVIFKVRLFAANYRQTCARCESLKNKVVTTNINEGPLDNLRAVARFSQISPLGGSSRRGAEGGRRELVFPDSAMNSPRIRAEPRPLLLLTS